jgi:hypothetical protein
MVPWVFIALENGDTGDKLLTMTTRMFFYRGQDGKNNILDKILIGSSMAASKEEGKELHIVKMLCV